MKERTNATFTYKVMPEKRLLYLIFHQEGRNFCTFRIS